MDAILDPRIELEQLRDDAVRFFVLLEHFKRQYFYKHGIYL